MSSEIRVCASGDLWVAGAIGSLETALYQTFATAEDHILITCYSITPGAGALLNALRSALDRGVLTRIVVNKINSQEADAISFLSQLAASYPHFEIWNFISAANDRDLHAKVACA